MNFASRPDKTAPAPLDIDLLWTRERAMALYEAPFNDLWTVPGEDKFLPQWKAEDAQLFKVVNPMEHFHRLQMQDFLRAILERRPPAITGDDGRRTVELFTAIYRATRERKAVRFPLRAE